MMDAQRGSGDEEETAIILKDWLPKVSPAYLVGNGWLEVNRRRHALAMMARTFVNTNYAQTEDAGIREGIMMGFVLGQLAELHVSDIEELFEHLYTTAQTTSSKGGSSKPAETHSLGQATPIE